MRELDGLTGRTGVCLSANDVGHAHSGRHEHGVGSRVQATLITLKMRHHANRSGYDRLCDYMDASVLATAPVRRLWERGACRLARSRIRGAGVAWYHRNQYVTELRAMARWMSRGGQVFHFLYGENSYRYLGAARRLRSSNRMVATFHTPRQRFYEVLSQRAHLDELDMCVAVSSSQLDFLSELVGQDRVTYVPHGIDTDYFIPDPAARGRTEAGGMGCLFVGRHLRDLDTLEQAIRSLEGEPGIRFELVVGSDLATRFGAYRNVRCHTGISDEALLSLYQRSDLLVMPLLDCTANNAILEAMACGLPVVTTRLPGVSDYVDGGCGLFTEPGDVPGLVEALLELKAAPRRRVDMAWSSRERAEQFSWVRVAGQMDRLYRSLS